LLALLQIEALAPNSTVVLLPADHYSADEATMARSLRTAANLASDNRRVVYLLGAEPDGPDPELGYIVPQERRRDASGVLRFVEKPAPERARKLVQDGALWNTFILAGSLEALLSLFEERFAPTVAAMRTAIEMTRSSKIGPVALELLYGELATSDFCRDVLERQALRLQVLRVPNCGWTDLGTPRRVEATVRTLARTEAAGSSVRPADRALFWDLAARHRPALSGRSRLAE
jgi:mannose-1-phosphate guanylyltransferase